ncbi:MAG: PhoH family protein [Planctomycetota bacterium]
MSDSPAAETSAADPKCFVLDTNVLLHDATALTSFADNDVILPMKVLDELDSFKSHNDELGRNSRLAIRTIDSLRDGGGLREGVKLPDGGRLFVISSPPLPAELGLEQGEADNRILASAYALSKEGRRVVFISKDINARVKADALGLVARDFEKQKVHFDELFTGWRRLGVAREVIDGFFERRFWEPSPDGLVHNEFIMLENETDPKHTAIGRFDAKQGRVVHLLKDRQVAWNVRPRSAEQRMAMELLLDEETKLVTLVGKAGTGKTLLALAAALELTVRGKKYEKVLVTRPIMPLGRDIGYLPGSMENKLSHWMQPIFDNLKFLLSGKFRPGKETADQLIESGQVELEALTYIRGRSIAGQFIIVDEAQNLTPHEVKTIVSRVGDDAKMVLTGDPYQIDNPYLDSSSNGLTYAADRLKGHEITGHMTLTRSERSPLASLAAERL